VVNDKDKYESKKYRFVVRRTNRRIITSVVYSTLKGDMTVSAADSKELSRYGVTTGLTNYAAAYCTGLLCARRLLKSKNLDKTFEGNTNVDGQYYCVSKGDGEESRRPFKAYLDVGLVRTTTGNRVFGAMKGACDGGLNIPHNERRFPGFRLEKPEEVVNKKKDQEKEKVKRIFTHEEHREHIFGIHVEEYYNELKKKDPTAFKKQFSRWEKALKGKGFEDIYTEAHKKIRANPLREAKKAAKVTRKVITKAPLLVQEDSKGRKWLRNKKLTIEARKKRAAVKMNKMLAGQ